MGKDRAIKVLKMGFPDAVTWNIGEAKGGGMKDLGAGEWDSYVCLEVRMAVWRMPCGGCRVADAARSVERSSAPLLLACHAPSALTSPMLEPLRGQAALIGKSMSLPPANSWTAGQTFVAAAEVPAVDKKKK